MSVFLNQIETAVPRNEGHSKFISFLPYLVRDPRQAKLVGRLAAKCQIERRYTVLTPSERADQLDSENFFVPDAYASTAMRMRRYRREALPLAAQAVASLFASGIAPVSLTHLIVTSCTGFYAPGLDLELQKHFQLRSDLERSVIGFMGCYAGINGLKAAYHIVRSQPHAKVLLVNLELCSLHLQDNGDPEKVLGFMQFADGCAASVISAEPRGLRLDRFQAEVFSDDAELIQWTIGDSGFDMILSAGVPQALARHLPTLMPRFMSAGERAAMKLWAIHPGGRAILDVVQERLELTDAEMAASRAVLRDHGNMSSATVLFVLKSIMSSSRSGAGMAMAFGPGLTVESLFFTKVEA